MDNKSHRVIAIAGASASGKTTLIHELRKHINQPSVYLSQDFYYHDLSSTPPDRRLQVNFDHPDAIDFALLKKHIIALRNHESVEVPIYDFCTHTRQGTQPIQPREIIWIDGTLVLSQPELCSCFDYSIFIDTPLDICLVRRIKRDMTERGRSMDDVLNQYTQFVRPMYYECIEPSITKADVVLDGLLSMDELVDALMHQIK
jgi:uridine kinase